MDCRLSAPSHCGDSHHGRCSAAHDALSQFDNRQPIQCRIHKTYRYEDLFVKESCAVTRSKYSNCMCIFVYGYITGSDFILQSKIFPRIKKKNPTLSTFPLCITLADSCGIILVLTLVIPHLLNLDNVPCSLTQTFFRVNSPVIDSKIEGFTIPLDSWILFQTSHWRRGTKYTRIIVESIFQLESYVLGRISV